MKAFQNYTASMMGPARKMLRSHVPRTRTGLLLALLPGANKDPENVSSVR
jgi:hypothetical protein